MQYVGCNNCHESNFYLSSALLLSMQLLFKQEFFHQSNFYLSNALFIYLSLSSFLLVKNVRWGGGNVLDPNISCKPGRNSFIHSRIYKAPLQEIYSEAPPAQPQRYRSVLSNLQKRTFIDLDPNISCKPRPKYFM